MTTTRSKKTRKRTWHDQLWIKFKRRPKWVKATMALLALMALGGLATGVGVMNHYSRKADTFDLGALDRIHQGSNVLGEDGNELGRIFIEHRVIVEFEDIPQVMINALLATEDSRYYDHSGVDYKGICRSLVSNVKAGRIEQGGSTISQQLARHVYRLSGRTYDRKLTEIFIARRMEKEYGKDEILTHYLNNIYMGSGFHGVAAASQGYFGKDLKDISVEEAALLAGIIKSPSIYNPFDDMEEACRVRNLSLMRMRDLEMISDSEYKEARLKPIEVLPVDARDDHPFFALHAVKEEVRDRVSRKVDMDRGEVHSTLNETLLNASIDAIQASLADIERKNPELRPEDPVAEGDTPLPHLLEGAAVVIENDSGRILSAVGGRDYRTNSFDYAFKGLRYPGTALLPLTYAAYFEDSPANARGFVMDAPMDNAKVNVGNIEGTLGEWATPNEQFQGRIPAVLAFYQSKTGAAVRAGTEAGIDDFVDLTERFGIDSTIRPYPTSFLGMSKLRLIELARAYTAFPRGGTICPEPRLVEEVMDRHGHAQRVAPWGDEYGDHTAVSPEVSTLITAVMAAKLRSPEYDAILDSHGLGNAGLAGYGGTSYMNRDGWFVGFDKNITCAVWVGRIDESPIEGVNPSRDIAFPIWAEIMEAASKGNPERLAGTTWARNLDSMVCLTSTELADDDCVHQHGSGLIPLTALAEAARPTNKCTSHGTNQAEEPEKIPAAKPVVYGATFVQPESKFLGGIDPYRKLEQPAAGSLQPARTNTEVTQ